MIDLVKKGSETAKNGFKNEKDVANKFNSWKSDIDAQNWLLVMGYQFDNIKKVEAVTIGTGHKTDVQVLVFILTKDSSSSLSSKSITTDCKALLSPLFTDSINPPPGEVNRTPLFFLSSNKGCPILTRSPSLTSMEGFKP